MINIINSIGTITNSKISKEDDTYIVKTFLENGDSLDLPITDKSIYDLLGKLPIDTITFDLVFYLDTSLPKDKLSFIDKIYQVSLSLTHEVIYQMTQESSLNLSDPIGSFSLGCKNPYV